MVAPRPRQALGAGVAGRPPLEGGARAAVLQRGIPSLHSGPEFCGRFRAGSPPHPAARNSGPNAGSFGAPGRPGGKPLRPIGAERRDRGGVSVKVAEPDPHRPGNDWRWMRKARRVWEEAHGPVPEGMVVVQLDGDEENFALPNLACVSRGVLARANNRLRYGGEPIPGEREVQYAAARVEEAVARREAGP